MVLLFISLVIGIVIGAFTFRLKSVKAQNRLPTLIIFTPFIVIFFTSFFIDIAEVLYAALSFAIGILFSWSYFDKKKKDD